MKKYIFKEDDVKEGILDLSNEEYEDFNFKKCKKEIKKIILPDTIFKIEKYGPFNGISKEISGKNIENIEESAFAFTGIEKIDLKENNICSIEPNTFERSRIENIILPENLKIIKENAFKGCNHLKKIVIPDSVCDIKSYAFQDCENLKEIYLPKSLKSIEMGLFSGSKSLRKLIIPDEVEFIDAGAFCYCNINVLYLPKNLQLYNPAAFDYSNIKNFVYSGTNEEIIKMLKIHCKDNNINFNLANLDYILDNEPGLTFKEINKIYSADKENSIEI